jgi:hypothetical protein
MKAVCLGINKRDGYSYRVVGIGESRFTGIVDELAQHTYLGLVEHSQRGAEFDVGEALIMEKANVLRTNSWSYIVEHAMGHLELKTRGDLFS